MTKQFRDNLIGLIAGFIFIVLMFMTDHLCWLILIIFGPSLLITWLLNKYKPLEKGPEIAWWKELLWGTFFFIFILVAYKIKFNETIFSWRTLYLFIMWLLGATLGIAHRRLNTK
ncbi:hypothetical protein [Weissella hellenica]|uniref:hypothetical protein n=1 Tax=Weissella hellenica TaxID=46256 RepID=UPI0038869193